MQKTELKLPPVGKRDRELWLNHAAGYILIRDVRDYARSRIDPALPEESRMAAEMAIDDALYGICMVLDGVPEPLQNDSGRVSLEGQIVLEEYRGGDLVEVDRITEPEGWCMGYHGWLDGDFGDTPPVEAS